MEMKYLLFLLNLMCFCKAKDDPWVLPKDECPNLSYPQCSPTVTEISLNSDDDVKAIYNLFKDNKSGEVVNLLVRRTNKQLQNIETVYSNRTRDGIQAAIRNNISKGPLQDLVFGLFKTLRYFIIGDLRDLHKSRNTHVEEYLDTIGVLSKTGIKKVPNMNTTGEAFKTNYLDHFGYSVRDFLKKIGEGLRPEVTDKTVVKSNIDDDVQWLEDSVKGGVDVGILGQFIIKNHDLDLRALYKAYEKKTNRTYLQVLINNPKKPWWGCDADLYNAVIGMYKITENRWVYFAGMYKITENRWVYFAERLHDSLVKRNYRTLNRILITRREIDLGNIKDTFAEMYGSLTNTIQVEMKDKKHKDYKTALLWLLQEKNN